MLDSHSLGELRLVQGLRPEQDRSAPQVVIPFEELEQADLLHLSRVGVFPRSESTSVWAKSSGNVRSMLF